MAARRAALGQNVGKTSGLDGRCGILATLIWRMVGANSPHGPASGAIGCHRDSTFDLLSTVKRCVWCSWTSDRPQPLPIQLHSLICWLLLTSLRDMCVLFSGSSTLCCVEVSTASSHMLFRCRIIAYGYHFDSSYAMRRAIEIAAAALRLTTSVTHFLCLSRGFVPTACAMASTLVMVLAFVPQAVMTVPQHGQHFFAHIRRRPLYAAIKPSTRALVRRMMQTTYNKL